MFKKIFLNSLLIVPLFFYSCSVEPSPINYGKEACNFCKMNIVDQQHGAEIVTKKGAHPTTKWLKYAKTALAKKQIRSETVNEGLSLKNFFPNLGKK